MKQIRISALILGLLSILHAGNDKLLVLGIIDRFGEEFNSIEIANVEFTAWLSSNPAENFSENSTGNSVESIYEIRGACCIQLSNFTGWQTGDTLCVEARDYNGIEGDVLYYNNYFEGVIKDSTSEDLYFGFEEFLYGTGYPLVLIYPAYENSIQESLPSTPQLFQNYPNPFNPVTQIKFALAKTGIVNLSVYNINGQKVAELANEERNIGFHTVEFDGSKFNSGIYYYTLEVDGIKITKKMVLTK